VIKPITVKMDGHVERMRQTRNANKVCVEKYEGKRPLGRTRRRWTL